MRKKAQDTGNLKSSEQQKVETKGIESKCRIVIEQANPQVVYVPAYNPVVVYGPPIYPYPPIYYPPPGYYAAGMAISFGFGVAMGAMWSGGWGYGCGWGGNNIQINNFNNFNRNTNINRGNNNWQHRPETRGGAPYGDRATADRFGGTTRGDSLSNRQAGARQQIDRGGGNASSALGGARDGSSGGLGAGNRGGNAAAATPSNRSGSSADR